MKSHTSSQLWRSEPTMLFVEYGIDPECGRINHSLTCSSVVTKITKKQLVADLMGSSCSWRSCLDNGSPCSDLYGLRLCTWHQSILPALDPVEAAHYLPNLSDMKAVFVAGVRDSGVTHEERMKRCATKASSLLEELVSKQLGQSIGAFFDHTKSSISNRAFSTQNRSHDTEYLPSGERVDEDVASLEKERQGLHEVFQIELAVSNHLESLTTRYRVSSSDSIAREMIEVHQLDSRMGDVYVALTCMLLMYAVLCRYQHKAP
ncbi:hypothetical protein PINS_up013913 [Pythium insidiosum]|nr:hypothetical protein PINS_up013913 [Pythium insidiosum]